MAGNRAGGLRAAEAVKKRFGEDFFREIGRKGGKAGHTGGFYGNHELAVRAGRKGGRQSAQVNAEKYGADYWRRLSEARKKNARKPE